MTSKQIIKVASPAQLPGLVNAVGLWAEATTDASSERRIDLLRDKALAVLTFFDYVKKHPAMVTPIDVKAWQAELEMRDLAPATVYARISRISSWYDWAMKDPELAKVIRSNPVKLARPKAPRAYQNDSVKALDDDQVEALLEAVKLLADAGDLVGKRDYALLVFYLRTGMRREEVIRLQWGNLTFKQDAIEVAGKFKGGIYRTVEMKSPVVRGALLDYLKASGRLGKMKPRDPLWIRHDKAAAPNEALSSHGFAKNLRQYALAAGIGAMHLHQTRHTFARMISEDTGSIVETQDALGHKDAATTRAYVERIAVKKDRHGDGIEKRLGKK